MRHSTDLKDISRILCLISSCSLSGHRFVSRCAHYSHLFTSVYSFYDNWAKTLLYYYNYTVAEIAGKFFSPTTLLFWFTLTALVNLVSMSSQFICICSTNLQQKLSHDTIHIEPIKTMLFIL